MDIRQLIHQELRKIKSEPVSEVRVIALLEQYIKTNPDDCEAALWYGDSLRIVGRCAEAIQILMPAFERAAGVNNRSAIAARAAMALEQTNREMAEQWYAKGVEVSSAAPGWIWALRGMNLAHMERFDAAIDCYHMALHGSDVDADEVYLNMARAYRAKGNHETAVDYLRRAKMIRPGEEVDHMILDLKGINGVRRFVESLISMPPDMPSH